MKDNRLVVLLSGLPGRMCGEVAAALRKRESEFALAPMALVGPEIKSETVEAAGIRFRAVPPAGREDARAEIETILEKESGRVAAVDYSLPSAIEENVRFFCRCGLPFVMGTTGGDTAWIRTQVEQAGLVAVVAPNMAIPIVLLQAAAQWLASTFPGALAGYSAHIRESHQSTKKDTSGTAKALAANMAVLGLPVRVEEIEKIRDPERQKQMGVPPEHLGGHAYHTYSIRSADGGVEVALTHNVHGRRVYAEGTLWALRFLASRIAAGERARCYKMIDVLGAMQDLPCGNSSDQMHGASR